MAYLRGWLVMVACFTLLWGLAFWVRSGADRFNADGQCTGIGFGCSLTPYDGLTFAMVIVGVPVSVVAVVAGSLWLRRGRPSGTVLRGVLAAAFGLAVCGVGLLVVAGFLAVTGG